MGYALLWVEALVTALLFFAAALALSARARERWVGIVPPALAGMLTVALGAAGVAASIFLRVKIGMKNDWLFYSASWFVALIVGLSAIRVRSGRFPYARAAEWPGARLTVAFCAAFALTCSTYWNIDASIRSKLAFARQEGQQMFLLVSPPSLPDEINAALVYEKAFVEYARLHKEFKAKHNAPKAGWPAWETNFNAASFPAKDPELAAFLGERQALIAALKRASAMTACSFDRDSAGSDMASMLLPDLARFRTAARLLAADARWKAAAGRAGEALESIAAIDRMAAHVGAQPMMVSALVAISIENISAEALEGVLVDAAPSAAELAPVMKENPVLYERMMYRSLKGEEAFGLTMFADVAEGTGLVETLDAFTSNGPTEGGTNLRYLVSPWRVFLAADDLASYRRYLDGIRAKLGQNIAGRLEGKTSLREGLARVRELQAEIIANPGGPLTRLLPPGMTRIIEAMIRAEARQRLTKLAVAISAYRAKNGKWPEQASALVPEFIAEIPNDPFDDKPLRFKKTGNKILLYSVGLKQSDDGGVEPDPAKRNDATDNIVFRLGKE